MKPANEVVLLTRSQLTATNAVSSGVGTSGDATPLWIAAHPTSKRTLSLTDQKEKKKWCHSWPTKLLQVIPQPTSSPALVRLHRCRPKWICSRQATSVMLEERQHPTIVTRAHAKWYITTKSSLDAPLRARGTAQDSETYLQGGKSLAQSYLPLKSLLAPPS